MLNSSDVQRNSLHAQHQLQGHDLLEICAIASKETHINDIYSQIETWSFEQFFGLTCHLFITTESAQSRQQLAQLLPKFGSHAVYSLIKILNKFDQTVLSHSSSHNSTIQNSEIQKLALSSLEQMALPPLVIGIAQILENNNTSDATIETIVPVLLTLASRHQDKLFSQLAEQLSPHTWNNIQTKLINLLSDLRQVEKFDHRERHIKIRIRPNETDSNAERNEQNKHLIEVA